MNKTSKSEICLFQRMYSSDKESILIFLKLIHTNTFFLLFLNLILLFNLTSCNTAEPPIIPPPPPDLRKITLTFEDASCTEVWLRVKADSISFTGCDKTFAGNNTANCYAYSKRHRPLH